MIRSRVFSLLYMLRHIVQTQIILHNRLQLLEKQTKMMDSRKYQQSRRLTVRLEQLESRLSDEIKRGPD